MIRTFATILIFASGSICCGQTITSPLVRAQQLNDDDVADVYSISDMTFVIRESKIFDSKVKETDLSKLISPAEAAKRGLPTKDTINLIDKLLGGHHEPELQLASAVNNDDAGFYWKMKWYLFPSPGGFTGIPYEYHAVVLPNGTQVKPELYLCDDYGIYSREPDEVIFSVLALDDLLPTTDAKVEIDKIEKVAERRFNAARQEFDIEQKFKSFSPIRIVYPGILSSDNSDKELEVWLVRFVHDNIKNPKNTKYVGSIAVWVTSDLATSDLTMGVWNATSKR